ncbi:MAG: type II toxin-antitoxin system VapC family toxin [Proteobacteria bacterium]|jgi:hypothetical protein|nr:type II toxin-antitoxin system VapC family toxin [Pseudomonadota bacterium]
MAILRVYADTSVFGGVFDDEFSGPTSVFWDQVREGRFTLVSSAVVRREMEDAPLKVRQVFDDLMPYAEIAEVTDAALSLRSAYLNEGIVGPSFSDDALHVALATVAGCSLVVSWNFKHIVHSRKIPLYNAINVLRGYAPLAIHSPSEVIDYEE